VIFVVIWEKLKEIFYKLFGKKNTNQVNQTQDTKANDKTSQNLSNENKTDNGGTNLKEKVS
jgi:hypothetical protein